METEVRKLPKKTIISILIIGILGIGIFFLLKGLKEQKLTEILLVLEVIKLTNHHDAEIFEKPLNEVIDSCRQVLGEIRVVVSRLIPEKNKGGKQFGQNSDCR